MVSSQFSEIRDLDHAELSRCLFDESNDAFLIVDPEFNSILDVNAATQRLTGFQKKQLQESHVRDLLTAENGGSLDNVIRAFQKTGLFHSKDGYWLNTAAGKRLAVNVSVSRIHTNDRALGLVVVRDITERKLAEEQLREIVAGTAAVTGGEFFSTLVNHLSQALGVRVALLTKIAGEQGDRLQSLGFWCNGAAATLTRFELAGSPCDRAIKNGSYFCDRGLQEEFPDNEEIVALGAESYFGFAIHDSKGKPLGNLCVLDDKPLKDDERLRSLLQVFAVRAGAEIERQHAEQALRDSRAQLSSILETASDVILSLDLDGKILYINQTPSVAGASMFDFLPPETHDEHRQLMQQVRETGEAYEHELQATMPTGETAWFTARLAVACDAGVVTGFTVCASNVTERKQAEKSLLESERRFRSIFEQAGVAVGLIESETGRFLRVNDKYTQLIGFSQEEMVRKTWMEITFPDDLRDDIDHMDRVLAREISDFTIEKRLVHRDGSLIWVKLTVSAIWEDGERPKQHIVIVEDITTRRISEERLIKSEYNLRRAQEIAHVGSYEIAVPSLSPVLWTYECFRILGLDPADGMPSRDRYVNQIINPGDRAHSQAVVQRSCAEGVPFDYEYRIVRPDGSIRWIHSVGEPVCDSGGSVVALVGTMFDITKRKEAEISQRDSETQLRSVLETATDFILSLDLEGNILYINRTLPDFLRQTVIGTSVLEFVPPELQDQLRDAMQQVRETHTAQEREVQSIGAGGKPAWYLGRIGPVLLDGELVRFTVCAIDVTERRAQQERVRLAEHTMQTTQDAVYWIRPDGSISYVNERAAESLQYSVDELCEMTVSDIDPNFSLATWPAHWDKTKREGTKQFESIHQRKDGSQFDVEISKSHITFEGQELAVSFARDITERKLAEDALDENRRFIEAVASATPYFLYVIDAESRDVTYFNRSLAAELGYEDGKSLPASMDEILGFMPPEEHRHLEQVLAEWKALNIGDVREDEYHFDTANGSVRSFLAREVVFETSSGPGCRQILGTAFDITERKRAAKEQQETHELLSAVVEGTSDAIFVKDREGRYVMANSACVRVLEKSLSEVIGKRDVDLFPPDVARELWKHDLSVMNSGQRVTLEERIENSAGEMTTYLSVKSPQRDDSGNVIGLIGIARDITARTRAEEALRHVVDETSKVAGEDFYPALVEHLAEALNVRYVVLAKITGDTRQHAKTLAVWSGDHHAENFEYELAGTPCANVIEQSYCVYSSGVQQLFPDDTLLADMAVESYAGTPLIGLKGETVGILAALDNRPLAQHAETRALLEIFAKRAATEIERSRTERALHESQAELKQVLERLELAVRGTSDGLWDWDMANGSVWISPRGMELLGYEAQAQTENSAFWSDIIHPDDIEQLQEETQRHRDNDTPYDVEHRMRLKNGEYRWFQTRGRSVRDASGLPTRMSGSFQDITDRRQAESALKTRDQLYRNAISAANAVVYQIDFATDTYTYMGNEIEDLLGYSADEITPALAERKVRQHIMRGAGSTLSHLEAKKQFREGKLLVWKCDVECEAADGRIVWLADSSVLLYDSAGAVTGCLGIATDVTDRRLASQQIEGSRAEAVRTKNQLIEAIESLTEAFALYDPDDRLVVCNTNYRNAYDLCDDLLVPGAKFEEHIRTAAYRGQITTAIGREEEWVRERIEQHRNPQGLYFQHLGNGRCLQVSERKTRDGGIVGVRTDITERKRAEDALRESEAMFRSLADSNPALVAIFQGTGHLYVNPQYQSSLGYSREELLKMSFLEYVHPEFRETVRDRSLACQQGEDIESRYEIKLLTKKGQERWIDFSATRIDFMGEPAVLGVALDITDRKQAQDDLDRFFTQPLNLMAVVGFDGMINEANLAFEIMLGYEREAVLAQSYLKFIHADDHQRAIAEVERLASGETTVAFPLRMLHSDGTKRHVIWSAVPDLERNRFFATGQDVTERYNSERLVRLQSEMLEQIATGSPLQDVLEQLCHHVESAITGSVCSLMELDESENCLNVTAGPSLTAELIDAINGLQPGEFAGSCGTAAYTGESTIVADTATDPRWTAFIDVAQQFSIAACWSIPIKCDGHVVATFAVSHAQPRSLEPLHDQLLEWGAHIAGVAIERKRVEKALRESEQKYRTVFENSPVGIGIADETGALLDLNQTMVNMGGYSDKEDVDVKSVAEFYADATDRDRVLQKLMAQGFVRAEEVALRRKDGTHFHALMSIAPVAVKGQRCTLAVVEDISSRRELEFSLQRFRDILDQAGEAVFVIDPTTARIIDCNTSATRNLQYSRDALLQLTVQDIQVAASDVERSQWATFVDRLRTLDTSSFIQGVHRRKDGSTFPVEVTVSYKGLDGKEYLLAIARDVTKRHEQEEELRFRQSVLESQTEASVDGILVVSTDRQWLIHNQRFLDIWRIPDELTQRRSSVESVRWAEGQLVNSDAFVDQTEYLYDHPDEASRDELIMKDGRVIDRHSAPVKSPDGERYGRVWFYRDITEQHQTNHLVQLQSDMLEEIATGSPLVEVFDQLCRHVESCISGAACSLMELDEVNNCLNIVAAPSLTDEIIAAFNGLQPAEFAGSCGTAAHTGEAAIVTDTATDPRWEPFKEVAQRFGIGACWSLPIKCDGKVVATFAISHAKPRTPEPLHEQLLEWGAHIAGVAIQRARTDAALQRFRTILDHAGEGIYVVDPSSARFLDVNESALRELQYTREELLGLTVQSIEVGAVEASFEQWEEHVERIRVAKEPVILRGEHRRKDGTTFPVEVALSYENIEGHEYILAVARDITLRTRSEDQMRDRNRMLEQLATGSSLEHVLETLTRSIEGQIPGMMASVLLLDDERLWHGAAPSLPDEYNRIVDGLKIGPAVGSCGTAAFHNRRVVVEDIHTDPLWAPFREVASQFGLGACWSQPITSKKGKVLGTLALYYSEPRVPTTDEIMHIDSSAHLAGIAIERKQDEQSLRDSEEEYRVITDSAQEAILTIDEDGRIVFANPAMERIFGYAIDELIGKPVTMLVPESLRSQQASGLRRLVEAAGHDPLDSLDVSGLRKDGQIITAELSFGEHIRRSKRFFTGTLRDVSERRRVQRALKEREAELAHVGRLSMLGEAVAEIAHEINQPLYAISNFAKASCIELDKGRSSSEQLRGRFERIDALATTAGSILNRIRGFLRKQTIDHSAVSVNEIIDESIQIIGFEARHKQVEVKAEPTSDETCVLADRVQIHQVLVNLLKNAFDAMEETPSDNRIVLISSRQKGDIVEITMHDRGHGLGDVVPETVFAAFHSTKSEGMGMGLAISRSIIETHGGKLWVTENEKEGVTFHVTLPIANESE